MKKIFFICLLYCWHVTLMAQVSNIEFDRLSIQDGLSQSSVFCIVQDQSGFLWMGTHDGLNRYDGYNFVVYKNRPNDSTSLGANIVRCMLLAPDGDLLVGTQGGGVCVYNPAKDNFRNLNPSVSPSYKLNDYNIRSMLLDNDNNVWLATNGVSGNGNLFVFNYKTGAIKTFSDYAKDTLPHHQVNKLIRDDKNYYWIGTAGGLARYTPDNKKLTYFFHDNKNATSLPGNDIVSLYQDRQKRLWVGTNSGLALFNYDTETFTSWVHNDKNPLSIENNTITDVFEDSSGKLWIGTQDGLHLFDVQKNRFLIFQHSANDAKSLGHNNIATIYEDKAGIVWIGTWEGGVNKYDRNTQKFISYKHQTNANVTFPDKTVRSLYEDHDGTWWIGYVVGNLVHYDPKQQTFDFYSYSTNGNALADNTVSEIMRDSRGDLWIGTWSGGLHKAVFKNDKIERFEKFNTVSHQLADNRISKIYEDAQKRFWICTENGLDLFDRDTKTVRNIIKGNMQHAFEQQHDGSLWVGGWSGLYRIQPSQQNFDVKLYGGAPVISMCTDKTGSIWVGTFGQGIAKVSLQNDSIVYTRYTTNEGLPNNVVYGMYADHTNTLWISTNKGLSRFDIEKQTFVNYDHTDGLQNDEFFWGACYQSPSGKLFFGGIGGFNVFKPEDIKDNAYIPPVVVTDFKILNASVTIGQQSPLRKSIYQSDTIELSHDDKIISFEFSALHFSVPTNNKYAYKLDGFNNDWTLVDADKRFVTYTNLEAGTYVFRVRGSNSDGVWNESGVAVTVIVHPPIWETWWFRTLGIVLFASLVWWWYRRRISRIHEQKRLLEEQVEQRTAEVVEQKSLLEEQNKAMQVQAEQLKNANQDVSDKNRLLQLQHHELHQTNQMLEKQKTELENTLHTLQTTQKKLVESEKMASLGNLVAGVAHEINTPVGVAITSISTVINDIKDLVKKYEAEDMSAKDFEAYVQMFYDGNTLALKNLERTAGLVRSFKQISLDQHSEQERNFNLNDYLYDILASISPEFKHTQIKIDIDCPPDLVINSYPGAFAQIFTNLLTNSKRHGFRNRDEGQINIVVKRENEKLLMEYTDNGHGINEKVLPRIFDPFFTTDMQGGTGLGLNILYNLVTQKLGGEIKCESREGEGVKFLMTL